MKKMQMLKEKFYAQNGNIQIFDEDFNIDENKMQEFLSLLGERFRRSNFFLTSPEKMLLEVALWCNAYLHQQSLIYQYDVNSRRFRSWIEMSKEDYDIMLNLDFEQNPGRSIQAAKEIFCKALGTEGGQQYAMAIELDAESFTDFDIFKMLAEDLCSIARRLCIIPPELGLSEILNNIPTSDVDDARKILLSKFHCSKEFNFSLRDIAKE